MIKFPEPVHFVQENMINFFFSEEHLREMWVSAGTKTGKTFAGAVGMSASMLIQKQAVNRWFAPIYIQSKIGMRYMKRFLPINNKKLFSCNESSEPAIIYKKNDNLLQFMHAQNPGGVEGEGTLINVLDEAAKYKNGEEFYASVKTTTTQTKGKIIVFSTPLGKKNFFYKKWKRAHEEMLWCIKMGKPVTAIALTAPTVINPTVSKESIDDMRRKMPDRLFRQFVMAEFLDDGAIFQNVLNATQLDQNVYQKDDGTAIWMHQDSSSMQVCIGVDWGKKSDYSVFIAFQCLDSIARIVGIQRFRKVSYITGAKTLESFQKCFKEVHTTYHDGTGVGEAINDILVEFNVDANPITFTNDNKNEMVIDLMLYFEKGIIEIPTWQTMKDELDAYSVTITNTGKFRYEADPTSGQHDDIVSAMLLALSAYKRGQRNCQIIIPYARTEVKYHYNSQINDYIITNEDELMRDFYDDDD